MEFIGGSNSVYSFRQDGSSLSGTVEGTSVNFTGGSDVPAPIVNGKIDGNAIEFKVGPNSFTGNIKGDRIELQRTVNLGWERPKPPEKAPDAPDIGPAPDGSDPSIGNWHIPPYIPVVLKRAQR
jgi:beta-galactosidase